MKKSTLLGVIPLVLALAACGTTAPTNPTSPTTAGTPVTTPATTAPTGNPGAALMGKTVTYDPSQPVNGGQPITIEMWYWTGAYDLFQNFADTYSAVHPNVTIKLVENPWADYWTKLPLALQGTDGPAIFNVHNSQHDNLIGYMAPYDIPVQDIEADFTGAAGHVIDGKIYYTDYGLMTVTMFYNTDMWKAAGLTDKDIPKTWDQFREIAKKLTIRDAAGNLVQAGFGYNGGRARGDVLGMQYQYGQNLFTADNQVTLNNDAWKQTIQRMLDLYNVDKVGDASFGDNSGDNFGQGKVAMYLGWGFMTNQYTNDSPGLHWGVFEVPTPTDATPYAYHRYNGESTFGINKNAPADQQAVAQDMVRFFLANDAIQKKFCVANSVFPMKVTLKDDPDLLAIPTLAALAPHLDRYIWPGPMPATVETNVTIALQDIFYNGVDMTTALTSAEKAINADLKDSGFVSQEPMYKYAGEALR